MDVVVIGVRYQVHIRIRFFFFFFWGVGGGGCCVREGIQEG